MSNIEKGTGIYDIFGNEMLSYPYIEQLRAEDASQKKKNFICAQRGGQENILKQNADISIVGGARGGPLPCETLVVTPRGYRRIGGIRVGDEVLGSDGKAQKVVSFVNHGQLPCYKIVLSDASTVFSSFDHPWYVESRRQGESQNSTRGVMLTEEIARRLNTERIFIPSCGECVFDDRIGYDNEDLAVSCACAIANDACTSLPMELMFGSVRVRKIFISELFEHSERLEDGRFRVSGKWPLITALHIRRIALSLGYCVSDVGYEDDCRKSVIVGTNPSAREIVKCEEVGDFHCCCIGVSNPDSLFLIEDFVVTHNSKSFSILLEAIKDIRNKNFSAIILRDSKPDLENIINDSKLVFKDYGTYISSDRSMYWDLYSGGKITFSYHGGSFDDFKVRFQGKQYSYIAIDEIVQCDFEKFCYLMTTLRNAYGIRNRIIGSCNPGPGWVSDILATYWVGSDGYPIPERDGHIRYVYMTGAKTLADFVWGDTREEVYEKVKDEIKKMWTPDMDVYGDPKDIFILSIAFVSAKLTDNKKLLESDPSYISRLSNQSAQAVAADLMGNWFFKGYDNDYVTDSDMKTFFNNQPQLYDEKLRAAQDIAFLGGDMSYTWLMRGKHIVDVDIAQLDAKNLIEHTRALLHEWGVKEEDFAYDASGIGQAYKGFFRRSVPFNNLESPWGANDRERETAKKDYDTLKSQTAFALADAIKYGEVSIADRVLEKRVSGKGYENVPLRDILMQERIVFTIDEVKLDKGKGKCIRQKADIKKILHRSPDAMEGLIYLWSFFVKVNPRQSFRPSGMASFSKPSGPRSHNTTPFRRRNRLF